MNDYRELTEVEMDKVTGGIAIGSSGFLELMTQDIRHSRKRALNPQPEPPGFSFVLISPQPQPN
jgi:hypothetical protein